MKKNVIALFVLSLASVLLAALPMENVGRYNIVLVHGAADRWGGMDCENGERATGNYYKEAYEDRQGVVSDLSSCRPDSIEVPDIGNPGAMKDSVFTRCDTAYYIPSRIGGIKNRDKVSSAVGMVKEVEQLLRESIFDTPEATFLQRPFVHPAGSPADNGDEIGQSNWKGENKCSARRSLIEEAQEFKAKGAIKLDSLRNNGNVAEYRTIPSRNILIAHSMGGVASREYVQGGNYKHDVDKLITLDSPHSGTYSLDGLLQIQLLQGAIEHSSKALSQKAVLTTAFGLATLLLNLGPLADNVVLNSLVAGFMQGDLMNLLVDYGLDFALWLRGGFDYYSDDALVGYIQPGSTDLNKLNNRSWPNDGTMLRILYSEGGVTFGSQEEYGQGVISAFVPDGIYAMVKNIIAQISHNEFDNPAYYNNILGSTYLGYLGGLSLTDQGSLLIPHWSGSAQNVLPLKNSDVDVIRVPYAANEYASEFYGGETAFSICATAASTLLLLSYIDMYWGAAGPATRAAVALAASVGISSFMVPSTVAVAQDMITNHQNPALKEWQRKQYKEKVYSGVDGKDENYKVLLMEDFLYERPFVNLALSLSDSALRSVDPGCYYELDDANKQQLCEVGLYGSRDSIVVDTVKKDTTHIYNAVAERLDSIGNVVRDSSGNVVYDSVYYGAFEQRNYSDFRNSPLKFKSESDWYKVGVKVDRWERVDGLKPNGDLAPKGVPIRHVERYSVPDIVVTGFIEKYSFVVDDLMPHRMRQIKMTFNSNEEIAWECNIKAAEDDPHACAVYKRLLGNSWGNPDTTIGDKGYVAHPIKKNGRFDFEARKYFGNLANIQKDNQNTVMISMVNKIGLSNTQRFYYLFKATDNMLKPKWPEHDVVLNAIDGFKAYVSALDYQGFRVYGASDEFFRDSLNNYVVRFDSFVMDTAIAIGNNGSEYVFASKRKDLNPAEGEYRWVVSTNISNKELKNPSEPDSSKTDSYEVHFKVDRTAPAFVLTSDAMMNPDSSMFITRFKWAGKDSAGNANGSDIRAMRWTLEKASSGSATSFIKYAELPALYDVASNEFAIAWDKVPQGKRDSMGNGLYRIAAYAIDYAVPNEHAYHAMNALVDKVFTDPASIPDSVWTNVKSLKLNDTTIYAEFRVDHSAPSFTFRETRAVTAADTVNYGTYVNLSGKYDALRRNAPARDSGWTYVSGDSLLQIGYTVMDSLNGLDSAAVTIGWNFVHIPDTNVIDRAGDSVWVFDSLGGKSSGTWTEMAGLRMADGEYSVRAVLRDAAKNVRQDVVPKRVRVDRTAPQIVGLTSDHLVYMDKDGDFSATILLSESGDVGVNRTGMHCSYRVLGGSDTSWHEIRKGNRKLLANDTVNFAIAKTSVDTARGLRYLEAACVDAAGNVSVRTDLFHVGARFPQITYPQADSIQSDQSFIPIVGIAPKASSADSLSSVYRLRYRVGNDTTWKTDKIKVVAANRSTSADNVSRMSQSTEGVLGYLENDGFGSEAKITVELAVASCETCDDWAATTTNFVVVLPDTNYNKPAVEFAVTRNRSDVSTFKVDDGPVDISVRLKNKFNGNYMLRVYAEDSKRRGIFDASNEKVFYNPYYGTPTAAADTTIWFYEKDGKYHLAWKNLDKINLKVGYNSAKFGETCVGSTGNTATGCSTEHAPVDFGAVLDVAKAYLADYPEWMPPAYIDSAMTISDGSGEIVMEAEDAFRVYMERKDPQDTSALNVPVYFGESDKPGFYWIAGADTTVSPLMTGWTVNPNVYGLDYRWDGIATSGAYPSGDITLYAEVTENILDNPFVDVVSKTLKIEQKEVELIVPKSLPDYVLLMKAGSGTSSAGTSDTPVYELDSMKVYFGLKNADAHVRISIFESDSLIKELLNDTLRAHTGDSAYSIKWLAVDSKGMPLEPGAYYVKFEVNSDTSKTKKSTFNLKLRENVPDVTPDNPKTTSENSFFVAEAKEKADGRYVYEPYADYLIAANMSGWYLPDTLRNKTYNVNGSVEGTQNILGYRPERFSLGIKRHRDTLEMYILVKITIPVVAFPFLHSFDFVDEDTILLVMKKFTKDSLFWSHSFNLEYSAIFGLQNTKLDVIACSKKNLDYVIEHLEGSGSAKQRIWNTAYGKCEWRLSEVYGGSEIILNPRKDLFLHCDSLPADSTIKYKSDSLEDGCDANEKDGYLDSVCVYPKDSSVVDSVSGNSDSKYNPNRKLFDVTITPNANGRFFDGCLDGLGFYWDELSFNLRLTIPDSYWNAPFGMDNLVNRTIRFDHTNQTIFNGGNDDGYWNAVVGNGRNNPPIDTGEKNYFDGNEWQFNQKYGLLTPFEVQKLKFYPINVYPAGSNVFRFDDEGVVLRSEDDEYGKKDDIIRRYMYPSSFELKFYGQDSSTHHFEVKVIGDPVHPDSVLESECNSDPTKFVESADPALQHPCQFRWTSQSHDSVRTPLFKHGNVFFYVGMNRLWSELDNGHRPSIAYPADPLIWRDSIKDFCSDSATYEYFKKISQGDKDSACYKYYGSGSRVHFYFNDYDDDYWKYYFLTDSMHYIRNLVNSPDFYNTPKDLDSALSVNKVALGGKDFSLNFKLDTASYENFGESDSIRFVIRMDSLNKIRSEYKDAGITLSRIIVDSSEIVRQGARFAEDSLLYVNAVRWYDTVYYRRSNDTTKNVLERKGEEISLRDIYVYRVNPEVNSCKNALFCADSLHPQSLVRNPWIKNPVVDSARLLQVDSSEHPVLEISGARDSLNRVVGFRDTVVHRPSELVEIRGKLDTGKIYSLSFLNNSTYYSITDSLKMPPNCQKDADSSCHLLWFNVNKLQGHTQFLLTWGGSGNNAVTNPTNAMHFNMYVGSNVKPENNGVVKSMYGELSVTFPQGSLKKADDFTVRTVNVQKDYGFGVFKNMPLTGPVMEVLPSMTFTDTNNLPRIQMRISKKEIEDMHVTPQTLRLYKVDFENRQFVPLEDALYGFLDVQGSPVMDLNGTDTLKCRSVGETNARCTDEKLQWEYVLISAQTRTFSVFVAMDTLAASMRHIGLEVLPAVAKTSEREVRVYGIDDFNLYVDNDSLWNDEGDLTPMIPLSFSMDMNGVAHVTLPVRNGEIDTNYVFAFAKVNSSEVFAPAVEKTLTVPAQFACHVPSDSLWMGIDNGYLAYGASCNHPGQGTLSLYKDNSLIAEVQGEIPDTIKYDGKKRVGGAVVGTVAPGRYESRYVGVSVLGEDVQLAGPAVRTDGARPVVSSFEVLSGEDVLDRIFTVRANIRDIESGVAHVVVTSRLGNATRAPLELVPDSLGNVTGEIQLTRSELAKCSGCKLSLEMRVEDYGHNHTERTYESEKLYPYPTELALWYPSHEGTGKLAYEYIGTGHNLHLDSVKSPWLGDAGMYFSMPTDRAVGIGPSAGRVNLGTSGAYSFEARIKIGNVSDPSWRRVLGFKGVGGLEMELLVHNRKLRLREGSRTWETPDNALPVAKEWAHVVVTVDSSEVNFYVNGEIMKSASAEPLERELDGVFSAGADGENSFVGHVADMRMYKKALSGGEVFALSQPVVDDKITEPEIVEIVTVPMTIVDGGNGFEPEFSCAVAGNRYFESTRDNARLTLDALIEKAATYKVMMYVRSAALQSAEVSVSPSAGVRYVGRISVSPVWRTVAASDISMNLSAGMHTITLEAPEGLQVAGFALVTANVSPASIAWNSGLENPERKIKTYVRYEGFADKKILQPRVRLRNVSNGQVRGYSVRYYFRGEESSMAKVHAYYPQDTVGLAVHSESAHTGFVEWKFANGVIPSGGTVFNGDGPHFGVHYEDWTPWNPYDDPSFVENASANFVEDDGIIVLDSDKRLIGGSCVEMEDSISIEVKARVYAAETRNDNQASEIQMKVENVGNVTLKNYDVRYYFFLEGGLAPEFNAYVLPDGVTASVESIGDGRWQVVLHASGPLVPGGTWNRNAQIALHCENWNAIWNGLDDPSSIGLGWNMVEAVGVNVFDSLGNRIYGNEPVWPDIAGYVACNGCMADSSGTPDIGLTPKNDAIPIHRTDDGLVISLPQYTNISLSLVNVVGVPVRNLYSGTLAPGEQFIHVNWTGIDLNRTYLMLRVNGAIKSTKLLSLL